MDALQGAIDVDTNIFFSINRMHNMYFDYFMSAYSGKWVWIPMYAAIWYVMLRNFHWKVTLFCMIGLALTITFADQACATWIRPYVERMRPSNLNNPISEMVHIVNNHRGGRYGFPSCHAANTFGLAFFIFYLFRNRALNWFIMLWAIVTCYSRSYLGVHYPGDILFGMLWGLLVGLSTYMACAYILRRMSPDRNFISTQYTSTGYAVADLDIFQSVLYLTYVVLAIRAVVL